MNLYFTLEYVTRWEEQLRVELSILRRGILEPQRRIVALTTSDGRRWEGTEHVSEPDVESFSYVYAVCEGDTVTRREWNIVPRRFTGADKSFYLHDYWRDIPPNAHLYSSAYAHISRQPDTAPHPMLYFERTLVFRVQAPQLCEGEVLALVGNQPPLGAWHPERALRMSPAGLHEWTLTLTLEGLSLPIEYKYVRVCARTGELLEWESGMNRIASLSSDVRGVAVFFDSEVRLQSSLWRRAGVVVPLFSLRSEGSQGVGDFGDLQRMVDWASAADMHVVQLLPINDTTQTHTWHDSYPYRCLSVFALHPLYIDLRQLPPIHDEAFMASHAAACRAANAAAECDYETSLALKLDYLHRLYAQEGKDVMHASSFMRFYDENQEWLLPYAVFCTLRDRYGTADYHTWPQYAEYDEGAVNLLARHAGDEVGFHVFVQYLLDGQLSAVVRHARQQGVVLKGDIPIGVSPHSVEAWMQPQYFHLELCAGAPPDDFSAAGQNWGFPTYNWENMAADGYRWWIRRLQRMACYFDAYRIDHVLGFFRIWAVSRAEADACRGQFDPALPMTREEIMSYGLPFCDDYVDRLFVPDYRYPDRYHPLIDAHPETILSGYALDAFRRLHEQFFYHRHNDFWYGQAMKRLPALVGATRMLVCAEDLGMVPACVHPTMTQLRILSLEIQTMPKALGLRFARLEDNPYMSVSTPFTHDMPTLRQWWAENAERRQHYYAEVLHHDGQASDELTGSLAEEILCAHLQSPSMLCLVSLQDWLAIDESLRRPNADEERINVPADPDHYWCYRMHLTLEALAADAPYTQHLRSLVSQAGR
ncbi:MAG: 4-alpha-glucanotransferase [Bacteroidaceae bacterium]|nr:4-alpha-glucanotransferase [Bacteroidaceae bacterium]